MVIPEYARDPLHILKVLGIYDGRHSYQSFLTRLFSISPSLLVCAKARILGTVSKQFNCKQKSTKFQKLCLPIDQNKQKTFVVLLQELNQESRAEPYWSQPGGNGVTQIFRSSVLIYQKLCKCWQGLRNDFIKLLHFQIQELCPRCYYFCLHLSSSSILLMTLLVSYLINRLLHLILQKKKGELFYETDYKHILSVIPVTRFLPSYTCSDLCQYR